MNAPAWFVPKTYGYGAYPVTWQGWALVAAFVLALIVAMRVFIGFNRSAKPTRQNFVAFLATVALLVAALWIVSEWTTVGDWHWRWGSV